ncbi:MAG: sigma-70 family RNA polymerase sigma factor [Deltaproteobacteria bacterium]|nr:sigma-70 family RNA polymerase sigma factor [Deltaproteobacteria bacterium]
MDGGPAIRRDEAALIAKVHAGDVTAFEDLIKPYEGRVYQTVLRIVQNPAEAADVYQEALLAAFEKLASFEAKSAFGTWLYRIAVNYALMHRRATARAPTVLEEDLPKFNWLGMHVRPVADFAESAEDPAERSELRRALSEALALLPAVDRAVVWLKDAEGLSHEEIATATGLTVSATRSRLHRSRTWLRARLGTFAGGH